MRTIPRAVLLVALLALLLPGCEDDPILEPTEEETDGGSYGKMHFVTPAAPDAPSASRGANPEIF